MKSLLSALILVACVAVPAWGQPAARLVGRVVESGSETGLAGATVEVGARRILSDFDGRFSLADLPVGLLSVSVTAYGYAARRVDVRLMADTSIVVELDPAPVSLDPLRVEAGSITVRGEVLERGTDRALLDVEIRAEPDHEAYTNVAGRFKLEDIPAGPPVRFSVRGFGYLPVESVLSAFEDTTVVIFLEVDPVVQRMIDQQVGRLEDRARPFATAVMPAMDREHLLKFRNYTALDLIRFEYGQFTGRINCILIDDRQSYNGMDELAHFMPAELQRIEVLERGKMLRIYTRDYVRDKLGEGGKLPMPVYVEYVDPPLCR